MPLPMPLVVSHRSIVNIYQSATMAAGRVALETTFGAEVVLEVARSTSPNHSNGDVDLFNKIT